MNLMKAENSTLREKLYQLEADLQRKRKELDRMEERLDLMQRENQ